MLPEGFDDCKVLIFNRACPLSLAHILRYRRQYGFKIICDLDDYWKLYPGHIAERAWKHFNTTQKMMEGMLNSDMVWTTTKRLADLVLPYNKNVEVIPNALPFDESQFNSEKTESDVVRVLYAGGTSHMKDLLSIRHLFEKLSNLDFQLILGGYNEKDPIFWDKIVKIMTGNGKIKNFVKKGFLPLESYVDHYRDCDIGIAPLEFNFFNSCKSNLKLLEVGCKFSPIVTSAVPPYSDEKGPVLMADSTKTWYTHLERLIKDKVYRQEQGQWLGEYVRENYNLHDVNEKRRQIFEHYGANMAATF